MQKLISLIDRITGCIGVAAAWLAVPLVLATVYEVAVRYFMNAPTVWAFEVGYMMMGAHFLLGAAYTLREGAHVRVDLVTGQLSPKTRASLDIAVYTLLILPCLVWLSWGLLGYFEKAWTTGETSGHSSWNPVVWPYRLVFLAAFSLLALQVIGQILKGVQVLRSPDAETERA